MPFTSGTRNLGPQPPSPHHARQNLSGFDAFAHEVGLPRDELMPWEEELRIHLLTALREAGPFPLVEWIDHRIGGEVDTFTDRFGCIAIRLRGAEGLAHGGGSGGKAADGLKTKREAFFAKLPRDSYIKEENILRDAIFEFLATWTSDQRATLADLCNDEGVERRRGTFIPKAVPLRDWIEYRIGEEVQIRGDGGADEFIHTSPEARAQVQAKYKELEQGGRRAGESKKRKRKKDQSVEQMLVEYCYGKTKEKGERFSQGGITYDPIELGGGEHQATVTLHCLGGEQFVGEICSTSQEASQSAAQKALDSQPDGPNTNVKPTDGNKPKKSKTNARPIDLSPESGEFKNMLNLFCQRMTKRNALKGEVRYDTEQISPGCFRAIVQLLCLEGKEYTSEVCDTRRGAEESAAQRALYDNTEDIVRLNAALEADQKDQDEAN